MAVPNIFANVTTAIPLSQLDANFATAITLGNTAVYLGNTTTSFGNVTLTNATVSSGTISGTTTINTSGTAAHGNLSVTGTGSVTTGFAVGGATPGTGGVAFPATAVAVTDANTLDDYEEGTWTPSLGGTATYTTQGGVYRKVGSLVWIRFTIQVNAIGTGSVSGAVSGLPFASAAYASAIRGAGLSVCWFATLAANQIYVSCGVNDSASTLQFTAIAAAGTSMSAAASIFGNGTAVEVAGCYVASS